MSEKLPYGEIYMSKIELRDALVKQIHENAALSNQIEALEQQLKTAKAGGVREYGAYYQLAWESDVSMSPEEYANNLEGK